MILNVLTFSPLAGGYSEGLDGFRFFFDHIQIARIYAVYVVLYFTADVRENACMSSYCIVITYNRVWINQVTSRLPILLVAIS